MLFESFVSEKYWPLWLVSRWYYWITKLNVVTRRYVQWNPVSVFLNVANLALSAPFNIDIDINLCILSNCRIRSIVNILFRKLFFQLLQLYKYIFYKKSLFSLLFIYLFIIYFCRICFSSRLDVDIRVISYTFNYWRILGHSQPEDS